MSKTIFALIGLVFMIGLISTSQSQAANKSDNFFLPHCSNYGDDLSYNFSSCVNRNFRRVARELGPLVSISRCTNNDRGVDQSYEFCIKRNFSSIERELRGVFLSRCSNYSRDRVDYSFLSCINSNFARVERDLRSRL
jgi:hypothetical protein